MRTKPGKIPTDGGLSRLDEDRAHSMADEGGASAALVEAPALRKRRKREGPHLFLAFASMALALLALGWLARRR